MIHFAKHVVSDNVFRELIPCANCSLKVYSLTNLELCSIRYKFLLTTIYEQFCSFICWHPPCIHTLHIWINLLAIPIWHIIEEFPQKFLKSLLMSGIFEQLTGTHSCQPLKFLELFILICSYRMCQLYKHKLREYVR